MTFIGTARYGLSLLNVIIPPEDDTFSGWNDSCNG